MNKHDETSGERAVKAELKHLKLDFRQEERINWLKGDAKKYRQADFYLPDFDIYVEFLGNWDTSKEHKQRYEEKMRVYKLNNIKCIWIYPRQLTHTHKVIQDGLLEHGVTFGQPTTEPTHRPTTELIDNPEPETPVSGGDIKITIKEEDKIKKIIKERKEKRIREEKEKKRKKKQRIIEVISVIVVILFILALVKFNEAKTAEAIQIIAEDNKEIGNDQLIFFDFFSLEGNRKFFDCEAGFSVTNQNDKRINVTLNFIYQTQTIMKAVEHPTESKIELGPHETKEVSRSVTSCFNYARIEPSSITYTIEDIPN